MRQAVKLQDIMDARGRIAPFVRPTPLVASRALSDRCGHDIFLKLENQQETGSFKLRGATNAIRSLTDEQKKCGVVGVSTGNHGRGLAHAARQAGVRVVICMSDLVPANKVDAIRALGADVRIVGKSQDEAQVEVDRLVAEQGMTMIPPFDHADVIAGQGTIGLDILEQCPAVDTIVVPVSGGGLVSGIARAVKETHSNVRIIGVSMARGAAMHASLHAGQPVEVEELETLADSLGGGIGLDNTYTFDMVRTLVDDIILLDEEEIAAGIAHAYWREGEIVEGSGSVAIGAVLAGRIDVTGPTVLLISGRNIDMHLHHDIISQHH